MARLRDLVHFLEVAGLLVALIVVGTLGYMWLEGLSPEQALHLTIATITTVGYGDPAIVTPEGRLFSNFLMIFGVGIALYTFWLVADITMGGHIRRALGVISYKREIGKMKEHIIVCGFGRVGQAIGHRLMEQGKDFVAVSLDERNFEHLPEAVPRIVGDATEEETLEEAGIERAESLLIAFGDDSATILAIITAKSMNPQVRVIARASQRENAKKMLRVGADEVTVPEEEGGRRMANHALPAPT